MFGWQARIPVDVMYGTPNCQTQTAHEYAANLRKQMDKAFALARKHSYIQIVLDKKIFMIRNYMRSHIAKETLCGTTELRSYKVERKGRWSTLII